MYWVANAGVVFAQNETRFLQMGESGVPVGWNANSELRADSDGGDRSICDRAGLSSGPAAKGRQVLHKHLFVSACDICNGLKSSGESG